MASKLKSSEDWYKQIKDFTIQIPNGWDRENFERSWSELITKEEFDKRVSNSICVVRPEKKKG